MATAEGGRKEGKVLKMKQGREGISVCVWLGHAFLDTYTDFMLCLPHW